MDSDRRRSSGALIWALVLLTAACQLDAPLSPLPPQLNPSVTPPAPADFTETGDVGNTIAAAEPVSLGPGINLINGAYGTAEDVDFYAITIPTSGYVTFATSPTSGGVGSIPAVSLFEPDGTLYMTDASDNILTALIPEPGTWYVAMSVYRDFPTRYFPTQLPSSHDDNGGSLGDGSMLLFGEVAQVKPKAPVAGDASFRTPSQPPDSPGFDYTLTIDVPPLDQGNTLATAEPVTLSPGTNTFAGTYSWAGDIDFYAITIPTSGYVTFTTSPTSGGVGSIPAVSLFEPDGTLYMTDASDNILTALIPEPGTWYVAMSVYRDFPTLYFPTQLPSYHSDNGGSLGDGSMLLFGEVAQVKPKAPVAGDASFRTPNHPPDGPGSSYTLTIDVPVNAAPTANAGGPYLGAARSPVDVDGSGSSDPDVDPLTFDWDWGDGSSSLDAGATPSHEYAGADIYDVCVTVTDPGGLSTMACTIAVVYDPDAGFVTGGGWIHSAPGAYVSDPSVEGMATFGFVAKYKKGAPSPTGNTEFQFHAAGMNFHSDAYEWLLVTGSEYARFKGTGNIQGTTCDGDPHRFQLWAGDGDPDTFRIRIWCEDEATGTETDVYDNGFDQAIERGSIVIHTKAK